MTVSPTSPPLMVPAGELLSAVETVIEGGALRINFPGHYTVYSSAGLVYLDDLQNNISFGPLFSRKLP